MHQLLNKMFENFEDMFQPMSIQEVIDQKVEKARSTYLPNNPFLAPYRSFKEKAIEEIGEEPKRIKFHYDGWSNSPGDEIRRILRNVTKDSVYQWHISYLGGVALLWHDDTNLHYIHIMFHVEDKELVKEVLGKALKDVQ